MNVTLLITTVCGYQRANDASALLIGKKVQNEVSTGNPEHVKPECEAQKICHTPGYGFVAALLIF